MFSHTYRVPDMCMILGTDTTPIWYPIGVGFINFRPVMESRQKSWCRFNELIPEKGTSSIRENLKTMYNDTKESTQTESLNQLRIWAQLDNVEEEFSKIFLLNELQWLLWTFNDNSKNKRKKILDTFNLDHLKKGMMESRQKSWCRFNELIPEKGTSSIRENLKTMYNDTKESTQTESLNQLRIWAQLDNVEEEFSKIFLLNELQWLLWTFNDNSKNKRKKILDTFNLDHLKKGSSFSEETLKLHVLKMILISLASFSDNGLRFRDVKRIHASFIREAGNFTSKLEYAD
ncbi:hypothetical protein Glove_122g115 [Diversispora epigaea]|uniref:Uncharacterized protein n=1 Tax=Diversispora epigaea TaxID=1348612 RepID=A0A397J8E1_9GLOM|nr:hypothetical protein Glove_122g115 [Diversispora epigaea]